MCGNIKSSHKWDAKKEVIRTNYAKLRGKLAEAGMTQRELAHAMSISINSLSRKINGASAFTVDEALKICKILSITDNHEKCNILLN